MNDIYSQRSNFKIALTVLGMFILIVTIIYSNFLANNLKESEAKNSIIYKDAWEYMTTNTDFNADISSQQQVIKMFALPIIIKNDMGQLTGNNFGEDKNNDIEFLRKKVNEYIQEGKVPIKSVIGGNVDELYVFSSPLLSYIRYFPIVQLLLVASFILLGYYFINESSKSEQNRVWVGMAKETAHQLGTPISAILAWLEHLKSETNLDNDQAMVVDELQNDVNRLSLVADRFSKIGSTPEMTPHDIGRQLTAMVQYMGRRAARKVKFNISIPDVPVISPINAHLFDWVIENLIRNSLDSMGESGLISVVLKEEPQNILILVSDTGKGIPTAKFKTIFQPGYSTKKRGWGLGLSLSKRIIESYHGGRIYVKESRPDEITTFAIHLKKT